MTLQRHLRGRLRGAAAEALRLVDDGVTRASLSARLERPGLISLMFHGLFLDQREAHAGAVLPHQPVSVAELRDCLVYFGERGYRFVRPGEVLDGLNPEGRYAWLTFDDGYANNLRALPVLRELDVPATIFVTTGNVASGRTFWWDIVYRECIARGDDEADAAAEVERWKPLAPAEIVTRIEEQFGRLAWTPRGEADRPLTPEELRSLDAEPLITIGNHTTDHAVLPHQEDAVIEAQLHGCQDALREQLGAAPDTLAYPNGNYDERTERIAREAGLRLAVTVDPSRTPLPLADERALRIGRYTLIGGRPLRSQYRSFRSVPQLRYRLQRAVWSRRAPPTASAAAPAAPAGTESAEGATEDGPASDTPPRRRGAPADAPLVIYTLRKGHLDSGTERIALATLDGLADRFRTRLIAPPGEVHEYARALGLESRSYGSRPGFLRALGGALRDSREPVLLTCSVGDSLAAATLTTALRRRLAHIHISHGGPGARAHRSKRLLNRIPGLQFVSSSEYDRGQLAARGVDPSRVAIIENFLNEERAAALGAIAQARTARVPKRAVMLSVFEPHKRIDLLLDAIERRPELAELEFRILGNGPQLEELRARARRYEHVSMPGFTSNVDAELAEADLLVHCCPVESAPISIIEGLAAGLPVLVPDAGGAGEEVEPGLSGLHFRANDADDLGAQLVALLRREPEEVRSLGLAARRRFEERFSQPSRCAEYQALIERMIDGRA